MVILLFPRLHDEGGFFMQVVDHAKLADQNKY
jgi:hypothetical protein